MTSAWAEFFHQLATEPEPDPPPASPPVDDPDEQPHQTGSPDGP